MDWTEAAIRGMLAEDVVPAHRMVNLEKKVHAAETTVPVLKEKIGDGAGCINADSAPTAEWLAAAAEQLGCEVHELVGPINARIG